MIRFLLLGAFLPMGYAGMCLGTVPSSPPVDCGSLPCCVPHYWRVAAGSDHVCYDPAKKECCVSDANMEICDKETQIGCNCDISERYGAVCCDKATEECGDDPSDPSSPLKICVKKKAKYSFSEVIRQDADAEEDGMEHADSSARTSSWMWSKWQMWRKWLKVADVADPDMKGLPPGYRCGGSRRGCYNGGACNPSSKTCTCACNICPQSMCKANSCSWSNSNGCVNR